MNLAVDLSNIRAGGGVTHISQILAEADPGELGWEEVTVWSGKKTLEKLPDHRWLKKEAPRALDGGLPRRLFWQQWELPRLLRSRRFSAVLAPGGLCPSFSGPVPRVVISQNLLPFDAEAKRLYNFKDPFRWKLEMLRIGQRRSMKRAEGLIFLSEFAKARVGQDLGQVRSLTATIPHGVETRFFCEPRPARDPGVITTDDPLRVLYVSTVDRYKHQMQVVEAVGQLVAEKIPLRLELVGGAHAPMLRLLEKKIGQLDPHRRYIYYRGPYPFADLHRKYQDAELFVFASSCENLPNILIEAMAAGLPILCSNLGPMPEVLTENGCYFDPYNARDLAEKIRKIFYDPALRFSLAKGAYRAAAEYSWKRSAKSTFEFITEVAKAHRG